MFSQVYYFVLYVSVSFVSDCTECPCWLFFAAVDDIDVVVVVEGSRLKRGRGLGSHVTPVRLRPHVPVAVLHENQ